MFGVFIILIGAGLLGVFVCLLDWFEQESIRRHNARAARLAREAHEAELAELWPARLQRRVYDQDAA